MSTPTPGQQYITQAGDTLPSIAVRAYGNAEKWPRLFGAFVKKTKTANQSDVFPGEVINIPVDPVLNNLRRRQLK